MIMMDSATHKNDSPLSTEENTTPQLECHDDLTSEEYYSSDNTSTYSDDDDEDDECGDQNSEIVNDPKRPKNETKTSSHISIDLYRINNNDLIGDPSYTLLKAMSYVSDWYKDEGHPSTVGPLRDAWVLREYANVTDPTILAASMLYSLFYVMKVENVRNRFGDRIASLAREVYRAMKDDLSNDLISKRISELSPEGRLVVLAVKFSSLLNSYNHHVKPEPPRGWAVFGCRIKRENESMKREASEMKVFTDVLKGTCPLLESHLDKLYQTIENL